MGRLCPWGHEIGKKSTNSRLKCGFVGSQMGKTSATAICKCTHTRTHTPPEPQAQMHKRTHNPRTPDTHTEPQAQMLPLERSSSPPPP